MTSSDQSSVLEWRDGVIPVSTRFDDPYFSLNNGLAETRHVFLAGNDLPDRLTDGFHIAELGFGTGLNLLATLIAWRATGRPGTLRYTSFEAFPLPAPDIARALTHFPEAKAAASDFLTQWADGATTPAPSRSHRRHHPGRRPRNPARMARPRRCVVPRRLFARQEPRALVPRP